MCSMKRTEPLVNPPISSFLYYIGLKYYDYKLVVQALQTSSNRKGARLID